MEQLFIFLIFAEEEVEMRKLGYLAVLAALVLILPVMALSWEDEAAVNKEGGMVDASELDAGNIELMKDERVIVLENEHAAVLHAAWEEIQNESDPVERERLQKKVQALKLEQEIVLKGLYLDIAVEQGDEVREMETLNALDLLHEPRVAQPAAGEPKQVPGDGVNERTAPLKNPDDA
jgi:hypothetical protein